MYPQLIGILQRPTIIVGDKPDKEDEVITEAIGDRINIIQTNVVNEIYNGKFDHSRGVGNGILDLISLIEIYQPKKIITLGCIAKDYINSIKSIPDDCVLFNIHHHSIINRYHFEYRSDYIKTISNELDK